MKKSFSAFLFFILMLSSIVLIFRIQRTSCGTTIVVPDDYLTIQEAVNKASNGDTIFIRSGTYFERIVANKPLSLIGQNRSGTIIDSNQTGTTICLSSDNVVIMNLTVRGCGFYDGNFDILLNYSKHCTIKDNIMKSVAGKRDFCGVKLRGSEDNVICGNTVDKCSVGFYAEGSSNNLFQRNTAEFCQDHAFILDEGSANNTIRNNMANNNYYGLGIGIGIYHYCTGNHIFENTFAFQNTAVDIYSSTDNHFYRNDFGNSGRQVAIVHGQWPNIWDNSSLPEGNYWDDYSGTDTDGNGIGDVPYTIDANNTDGYPLINPFHPRVYNLNSSRNYVTIKDAIGSPTTLDGHTVTVDEGIFHENVLIDKPLHLVGKSRSGTIIDGGTSTTVLITANDVTFQNFTVPKLPHWSYGIFVSSSNRSSIKDNTVTGNNYGIYLNSSFDTVVSGNRVSNNLYGIRESYSANATIAHNNAIQNEYGISFYYSSQSNVEDNNAMDNDQYGVRLGYSSNNTVIGNSCTKNGFCGIGLTRSIDNRIIANNVISNGQIGIHSMGIALETGSFDNEIIENYIEDNNYGIYFQGGDRATIYHNNFIDNAIQGLPNGAHNSAWDNGYPSGGNYWSDYNGSDLYSGPYQNETGSDERGDTPYIVDVYNIDHYPLTEPWPFHDIAVLNITSSKSGCKPMPTIGENCNLTVSATIENLGYYDENLTVVLYVNSAEAFRERVSLASRNRILISVDLNITRLATGNCTVKALVEAIPGEVNTTNNLLEDWFLITMPGDINADGKVDLKDVYATALAYGTSFDGPNPEGRKYNPNCDINNDYKVDLKDYYAVCKNYGK